MLETMFIIVGAIVMTLFVVAIIAIVMFGMLVITTNAEEKIRRRRQ